jgi:SET domain-containing protein
MGSRGERFSSRDIKPALLKIRSSAKYDGVGVFALRDIGKGTVVCDAEKIDEQHFFSWEEFEKIDPVTQQTIIDFCAQDKDGFYAPADLNYLPIPIHMNHSCDGNVGCDEENNFVAIKDIKEGEELCFDYALVISNPNYTLECKCGAGNCRKTVTGNDWMDAEFRKKNYRYMSPLLRGLVYETFGGQLERNRKTVA